MTGGVKIHDRWKENTPKVEGKYNITVQMEG